MSEQITQARLDELKKRLGPDARELADGIKQRGDPVEVADAIVILTLMSAFEHAGTLERGQQADILRVALTLASASTVYRTLQMLIAEGASRGALEGLARAAFTEMRTDMLRLATLAEMLGDSNAAE